MATNKDLILKNGLALGGYITSINGVTPTDGQLLIGSTSNGRLQLGTLTAGSGVSIANSNGVITITATGGGGGGAPAEQVTLDFGTTPTSTTTFTIVDAAFTIPGASVHVGVIPDSDEYEMDPIVCSGYVSESGTVKIIASSTQGPIIGTRKFFYKAA